MGSTDGAMEEEEGADADEGAIGRTTRTALRTCTDHLAAAATAFQKRIEHQSPLQKVPGELQ